MESMEVWSVVFTIIVCPPTMVVFASDVPTLGFA
jgi:hypothetical protein